MISYFILILTTLLQHIVAFNEINGCGGFLKSPIPIDFSKVDVKLYSHLKVLKDSSDCAPNNGYFFIPVYDKGDYFLKIEPPPGWHFEPREVPFTYDGITDTCSVGNDINFEFKGFTIHGKVTSKGSANGPENIKVSLQSTTGENIFTTTTGKNGYYQFAPVLPGKYTIKVSKSNLQFLTDSIVVEVTSDNIELPNDALVIAGYNVHGQVFSSGEPVQDVEINLFASDQSDLIIPSCSKTSTNSAAICSVKTDNSGVFLFRSLPCGKYKIRPNYSTFDFHPREMNIVVGLSHQKLSENFIVKGFSVKGRVLNKEDGMGLSDIDIYLNGNKVTSTDQNGVYHLDNMEPSYYTITAKGDRMNFSKMTIKLSAVASELDPLVPNEWLVCGRVLGAQNARIVEIRQSETENPLQVKTQLDGKFCQFLTKGVHRLSVRLTDEEIADGLVFMPTSKEITVFDAPINDIEFSQLLGIIKGQVIRLSQTLQDSTLTVKLRNTNTQLIINVILLNPEVNSYTFPETLPGHYEIEIESKLLCFNATKYSVTVSTAETLVPNFIQTGFSVNIVSSHGTKVVISKLGEVLLNKGDNHVCVPSLGSFEIRPIGCHGYDKDVISFKAGKDGVVLLNAISHDVTGFAYLTDNVPFFMEVTSLGRLIARLGPLTGERQADGSYLVVFTVRVSENQQLDFVPSAEQIIFNPETVEFRSRDDCIRHAVTIYGEMGVVIDGKIIPPLADVQVTLKLDESGLEIMQMSDENGKFSFGPLKRSTRFGLSAHKESYIFNGPDKNNIFQANKLAEIRVHVSDNTSTSGLSGVLLSLTGGDKFRKNSITEESGDLSFTSLSPGEYFLRPMMKEYKFEPASFIIQLKAGETKSIKVTGRRVAFSVFGTVTSLNGEPEPNVSIEVIGLNACSNLQEEAASEAPHGHFRVRGLQPNCFYSLRFKPSKASNIYRISPPDLVIQAKDEDIYGIQLIAFERISSVDLSVHITSNPPEHLKTLSVHLSKENQPEVSLHVSKLDTLSGGTKNWGTGLAYERFVRNGILVQLPFLPKDSTSYLLHVESNLNRATYYYIEPSVQFIANETFASFRLIFTANLRTQEQESGSRHYIALLVLFLSIFLIYGREMVLKIAMDFWLNRNVNVSGDSVSDSVLGKRKIKSKKI